MKEQMKEWLKEHLDEVEKLMKEIRSRQMDKMIRLINDQTGSILKQIEMSMETK